MRLKTRQVVFLALMISQALVLSLVENWIPLPFVFPGVKLGLANIVTMAVILFMGFRAAMVVTILRTLLASMFGGGFIVFFFSVSGGILSTVIMALLYMKANKGLGIVGISIAGAISHNVGQLLMASFFMKDLDIMAYLPVLMISGVIMGVFIGISTNYLSKAMKNIRI